MAETCRLYCTFNSIKKFVVYATVSYISLDLPHSYLTARVAGHTVFLRTLPTLHISHITFDDISRIHATDHLKSHTASFMRTFISARTPAVTNHIILTYLLTPWSRVLLEKLTGSAASQEIPRIFVTRRFLTVSTSVRHLSLS